MTDIRCTKNEYGRASDVKDSVFHEKNKWCVEFKKSKCTKAIGSTQEWTNYLCLGAEKQGLTEVTVELGHQEWVGFLQMVEVNVLQAAGSPGQEHRGVKEPQINSK